MPNGLSARRELRMTLLPGESVSSAHREARAAAAHGHAAGRGATHEGPEPGVRSADGSAEGADDDAAHYANAGPDCYWPEAG